MQNTQDYDRLIQAFVQEGCPLCRLIQESTQRYLDAWKYELFTDIGIREELRRSRGFCHTHTWQLADMGATLQLAQAYRDVLSDAAEQLEGKGSFTEVPAHKGFLQRWREQIETRSTERRVPCPACHHKEQAQLRLISSLRQALFDTSFYARLSASDGLCLDHFQLACQLKLLDTPAEDWLALLRSAQLACLQRLDQQLGELIRKHDYRFKDEARGSEMLSWKRAAGLVAGEDERA
jgi:hypothetical protein